MKLLSLNFLIFSILICHLSVKAQSSALNEINQLNFMTEEYPPLNFTEKGNLKGIFVDHLEEMLKNIGSKKTRKDFSVYPWARAYATLQNQKGSALFAIARTDKREKLFKWVGPVEYVRISLISLKKGKFRKITDLKDIKDHKVGVIRKDISDQLLESAGHPSKNISRFGKVIQSIKSLEGGRIDFWFHDANTAKWELKKIGRKVSEFEFIYEHFKLPVYFGFHKETDDKAIETLQKSLDQLKSSGKSKEILNHYLQ